ncbi:MAG: hypothetical protein IT353_13670 [Gemmatimonadaceae bacterium]|nr:hypothetical protein [Gemmatimonadaceae bacterium]
MVGTDAAHVERLVGVVMAARDAFIRASNAADSPFLQSLFRERAGDQARIATHLNQQR